MPNQPSKEDVENFKSITSIFGKATGDDKSKREQITDMLKSGCAMGGVFGDPSLGDACNHIRTKAGKDELLYTLNISRWPINDWIVAASAGLAVCRPPYNGSNMFLNSFAVPVSQLKLIPERESARMLMGLKVDMKGLLGPASN